MVFTKETANMTNKNKYSLDAKRAKDKVYFDNKDKKYRYKSNNRALSTKQVYKIVAKEVARYEAKIDKISNQFVNGSVSFEAWQKRMAELVRESHISLLRFGMGGRENVFSGHYFDVGRNLKNIHYDSLHKFAIAIKDRRKTKKTIVAQSHLFARAARRSYEYGVQQLKILGGHGQARRLLGKCSPHCEPCQKYAGWGWIGINDLILPTEQCDCRANCCCSVEYQY